MKRISRGSKFDLMGAIALRAELAAGADPRELAKRLKVDLSTVYGVGRCAVFQPRIELLLSDAEILTLAAGAKKAGVPLEAHAAAVLRRGLAAK